VRAAVRPATPPPAELFAEYDARIHRFNGKLNAIIWQDPNAAANARGANIASPLAGLPMTLKESNHMKGTPTTWGMPALRNQISQEDAVVVTRLRAAGANIFGNVRSLYPIYARDILAVGPKGLGMLYAASAAGAPMARAASTNATNRAVNVLRMGLAVRPVPKAVSVSNSAAVPGSRVRRVNRASRVRHAMGRSSNRVARGSNRARRVPSVPNVPNVTSAPPDAGASTSTPASQ
jgi:hypothetical protein